MTGIVKQLPRANLTALGSIRHGSTIYSSVVRNVIPSWPAAPRGVGVSVLEFIKESSAPARRE